MAIDAMDPIRELRQELDVLRSRDQTTLAIAGLEQYLAVEEARASEDAEAERRLGKAQHDMEVWKTQAPLRHASSLEAIRWANRLLQRVRVPDGEGGRSRL